MLEEEHDDDELTNSIVCSGQKEESSLKLSSDMHKRRSNIQPCPAVIKNQLGSAACWVVESVLHYYLQIGPEEQRVFTKNTNIIKIVIF